MKRNLLNKIICTMTTISMLATPLESLANDAYPEQGDSEELIGIETPMEEEDDSNDNHESEVPATERAATNWYEEYEYTLDDTNNTITLKGYKGNDKDIVIPAKAVINNKVYNVVYSIKQSSITEYDPETGYPQKKYVNHVFFDVNSIKLESGVRLDANCTRMFSGCKNLTELDISGADTSNVDQVSYMFYQCEELQ